MPPPAPPAFSWRERPPIRKALSDNPGAVPADFGPAQYTPIPPPQGGHATLVAVGDFNGDHFADVAVAFFNTGQVDVLLNAGSGTQKHK